MRRRIRKNDEARVQHLGQTRGTRQRTHLLQTPDTFVRAPLPGMERGVAIVHAAPTLGAGFTQYTAEMEPKGCLGPTTVQRFLYVLEGEVTVHSKSKRHELTAGGFAYLPQDAKHSVVVGTAAKIAVIEKPYVALKGVAASSPLIGAESEVAEQPVLGDESLRVRALLPPEVAFDFAMNIMTYDPGTALPMVEVHVMEHGLLMLEGGGIYRLEDSWYPVSAGDFIWMGPFCPQWFGALGKVPAKYLLYKDWNRGAF